MKLAESRLPRIHLFFWTTVAVLSASATVRYVDLNSVNPIAPYTDWSTAATNINDAIDAADPGDQILVTNGVYATGGRTVNGSPLTNRVAVNKPLTVQSVNGPSVTIIEGYQLPGTTNGDGAVRCVYLTTNSVLAGFTLTNGATLESGPSETIGGGVLCESGSSLVSDCLFVGNAAVGNGGGAWGGSFKRCRFVNNTSFSFGGGLQLIADGMAANCLIISNSAFIAGGVNNGRLTNCTVCFNSSITGTAGASSVSQAANCIIYYNSAQSPGANVNVSGFFSGCCTVPTLDSPVPLFSPGVSFTNAPMFMDPAAGDFRLQSSSPCINSGFNGYAPESVDLEGNPRIIGGYVDVGAYENTTPSTALPAMWLVQFGLPADGSADYVDSDGDGMNNWSEWISRTVPTNASSLLRIRSLTNSSVAGLLLRWDAVQGRVYWIERSAGLDSQSPFAVLATNLQAFLTATMSYTDSTATNTGPYFYRVGVVQR